MENDKVSDFEGLRFLIGLEQLPDKEGEQNKTEDKLRFVFYKEFTNQRKNVFISFHMQPFFKNGHKGTTKIAYMQEFERFFLHLWSFTS